MRKEVGREIGREIGHDMSLWREVHGVAITIRNTAIGKDGLGCRLVRLSSGSRAGRIINEPTHATKDCRRRAGT